MEQDNNFVYSPVRTNEAIKSIKQRKNYDIGDNIEKYLRMFEKCDFSDPDYDAPEVLAGVLLKAAHSGDSSVTDRICALWKRIRSMEALTALYFSWQDSYLSEAFIKFCIRILLIENSSVEWVHQWQRWLTARDVPKIVLGCAKAWCIDNQKFDMTWVNCFQIQRDSKLFKVIRERYMNIKEEGILMQDIKIVRVTVDYRSQGKRCKAEFENSSGITSLRLPDFPPESKVTLFDDADNAYTISFKGLTSLKLGDPSALSPDERETAAILLDGANYSFAIESILISEDKVPGITYTDATEHILLGFPHLSEEIINGTDNGLWSGSGERVLAVTVTPALSAEQEYDCSLVINEAGKTEIYDPKPSAVVKNCGNSVYLCSINTNMLSSYLELDSPKTTMKGWFSVSYTDRLNGLKTTYRLPVSLVLNYSGYFDPKNKYLCIDRTSKVSIDFGTSSTCAAIRTNIISMIAMSMDADGQSAYSVYENPTYLMLYQWEKFSEVWNNQKTQPILRRRGAGEGNGEDYSVYSDCVYDFGHSVKSMNIDDQRCLDSVIQHLKMIPKMLEDGKKLIFRDYDYSDEFMIRCGKGDKNFFDPIEFYGYLLGKAINHPNENRNRYYTKYLISYPVKFADDTRKTIEESLKRGLLRSLPEPVANLRDAKNNSLFQVSMKYSEPIACVGAACGFELKLVEDEPCLFGVFDFGGGTADYSFGMYRNADIDTEGYDEALELFGVDGDDAFGGELIIDKISYWILTCDDNKKEIIAKGIPFEKPEDEFTEDGFGNLIQSTVNARANIRKISELISRPFFEGRAANLEFETSVTKFNKGNERTEYNGKTGCVIDELFSIQNNERVEVKLTIDFEEINQKLKELFTVKCNVFSRSMDNAFQTQDAVERMRKAGIGSYSRENVNILMSGNSSRHPMIRECLAEIFSEEKISLIGEKREQSDKNRYKVTPKTAVAIGALKLEQMLVIEPKDISIIYVASEIKSELTLLLSGDTKDTSWHRAGVVSDGILVIYSSPVPDTDNRLLWHDISLDFENTDEPRTCFIRQHGRNEIEYIAVPFGSDPNRDDNSEYEIATMELY